MKYTKQEKIASSRYSSIKSRINYELESYWLRSDFIEWFIKQTECFYCKCTIDELSKFYNLDNSKRKLTRGRTLEVDRISDIEYTEENCVPSCYWCNNAKSDVFSKDEFKEIGLTIGKVIRNRILNNQGKL